MASDRRTLRTTFRDTCSSRQIALIALPCTKYGRRIFATVSTTSIPIMALDLPESHREPHRQRGPFGTPITPPKGVLFPCGNTYFTTWCPEGTSIESLVRVEGTSWRVDQGFETTKGELSLDPNESRSWYGWHRHVSLVMLAYAVMTAVRSQVNAITPENIEPGSLKTHPLVDPGNPAPYCKACPVSDPHHPHPGMVHIPTCPSSHSPEGASQIKNATVVLDRGDRAITRATFARLLAKRTSVSQRQRGH